MSGVKHLIECHCVLAIYKSSQKIINHKFPVYTKIDSDGKVITKLAKCNNCDTLHEVYDICRSEIKFGKDQTAVTLTKEDIGYMLSDRLVDLLTKTDVDISVWEHVLDIVEEKRWGETIVIKRDIIGERQQVKVLEMLSEDKFKIKNELINDIIVL
ncbi:MAG: hypothetical protein HOA52_03480 [Flavobacteriales bacterium]|nr:hypothetical protein [Flavobacteriales bacterium]